MKYYWFAWAAILLSIGMYILGGRDVANDLTASCDAKNGFVVDGKHFVCISKEEYFK